MELVWLQITLLQVLCLDTNTQMYNGRLVLVPAAGISWKWAAAYTLCVRCKATLKCHFFPYLCIMGF